MAERDSDWLATNLLEAMDGVTKAEQVVSDATTELHIAVDACRKAGWSWWDIAKVLGRSRQAVWERFAKGAGIP